MTRGNIKYALWNPEEDEILRTMYKQRHEYKEIAAALNRPLGSVASRIASLGLSKKNPRRINSYGNETPLSTGETTTEWNRGTIIRKPGITIHQARYRDK